MTHVFRGADHLNNIFRQKIIFDVLNWEMPQFGHLPLVCNRSQKISKRDRLAFLDEYKDAGFLPEVLVNYLMRFMINTQKGDVFSAKEIIEGKIYLQKVSKSPFNFDINKLKWLNGQYLKRLSLSEFNTYAEAYYPRKDINSFALSKVLQVRIEILSEIPGIVGFISTLPE
ncbi:MAG: hypothetical protein IPP81_19355 [Chitinophagaceae bacterium]|nr:hypothetical protein [Chitinophagaceae bacterium]